MLQPFTLLICLRKELIDSDIDSNDVKTFQTQIFSGYTKRNLIYYLRILPLNILLFVHILTVSGDEGSIQSMSK